MRSSGREWSQIKRTLVLMLGIALLWVVPSLATAKHAETPLCVMEIRTDKYQYHPDESVQLYMWLKVNTKPDLPGIENAQLEVELQQPFGTLVTLTHRGGISLREGAEWDELLLTLPVTAELFRNMGEYEVHAVFLSQNSEIYCEAYTSFIVKSIFGQQPFTRTLIVTSRRTEEAEPFVSKLAVWLEAAYQTEVQVIYQQGVHQVYQTGSYQDFDVLIYYATDYQHPPPHELVEDLFDGEGITNKKVVWIGYHLDTAREYLPLYGLGGETLWPENRSEELLYVDSGVSYTLSQPDPICVEVLDEELARVRATVEDAPVIVSAKNAHFSENEECFYFVGFHPTSYLAPFGAHLVFCDILNEVYGITREKVALVRLEDIHAFTEPEDLLSVTDFLRDENVPFTLALIPIYADNDGTEIHISWDRDFRVKVKNALLDGGELVLHGATHQYDGKTAVDSEFWDEKSGTPIDGAEYAEQRVADGLIEIEFSELRPHLVGWETPHYAASEEAYAVFEEYFELLYEPPHWGFDLNLLPYPVETENNLYVPTNLDYVSGELPQADTDRILEETRLLSGLQHGAVASFFYHPFLGVENIETIIGGLKEQGWTFKPVSYFLRNK